MRHAALSQALAIVLVVLCLTMAAAGVLGLRGAASERQGALAAAERLRQRAENYRVLADRLEGTVSYEERSAALEEREAQHSKDSTKHRTELSTFTATKYGLNMGTEAIDQADAQFAAVRAQFDRALPVFERGLGELNGLMDSLTQLYQAADTVVQNAEAHLNTARGFAAFLESGEELTVAQVVAAYDELLLIADETEAMRGTVRELRPALDTLAAFDPGSLTEMSAAVASLSGSLGAFGSVPVENYADFDVTVPYDMDELVRMQQTFSAYWTRAQGLFDAADAAGALLEQEFGFVTAQSAAALRESAQRERDALAARGDEPLGEEETQLIRDVYAANSEAIHGALDEADAALAPLRSTLSELGGTLESAQGQLGSINSVLTMAKKGVQDGADALYQARALIWWQMGEQVKREAALTEEKAALDEEAEELLRLSGEAADQKELESRLRSARAALMNRDAVRALADEGREPDAAARLLAERWEGGALQTHDRRQRACIFMLAGAAFGLIALPGAFSGKRARQLLIPPVLLCLAAALSAELMFRGMGRGDSYSCLGVALFAALQLIVSLPGEKRARRNKGL